MSIVSMYLAACKMPLCALASGTPSTDISSTSATISVKASYQKNPDQMVTMHRVSYKNLLTIRLLILSMSEPPTTSTEHFLVIGTYPWNTLPSNMWHELFSLFASFPQAFEHQPV